ncbi:MAG: hypothetical protein ACKOBE_04620 [Actinomycetota bacterium]
MLYPTGGPSVQRQPRLADAPFWTCTIRATQNGDSKFGAATAVDRTFNFLKARTVIRVTSENILRGSGPHEVTSTFGYVDTSMMSGLTSLGQLLTVNSLTPSICAVNSNALWDRRGGILNRTIVTGLANGACSLKFDFSGSAAWLPTTLTWNATISSIPVPTASSIVLQAISGNIVSGKEVVGVMSATSPMMYLSGMDKGRVQINVSVMPVNPAATMGLDSRGSYSQFLGTTLKATILTLSTCIFQTNSPTRVTTLSGSPAFVLPLTTGTCSVRFEFAGVPSLKVDPSTLTWSATVSN